MGFTENWIEAAGSVALSGQRTTADVAGKVPAGREATVRRTEENDFKGDLPATDSDRLMSQADGSCSHGRALPPGSAKDSR